MVWSCNLSRCTAGIATKVGGYGRAKVAALPGRGMKMAMNTAVGMLIVNKGEGNLVVVHAGFNDALGRRGKDLTTHTEEGVKQLRVVTSEMVHIVMCTIAEVRGRGAVQEANRIIRRLSSKKGYEVMNVKSAVYQEAASTMGD